MVRKLRVLKYCILLLAFTLSASLTRYLCNGERRKHLNRAPWRSAMMRLPVLGLIRNNNTPFALLSDALMMSFKMTFHGFLVFQNVHLIHIWPMHLRNHFASLIYFSKKKPLNVREAVQSRQVVEMWLNPDSNDP